MNSLLRFLSIFIFFAYACSDSRDDLPASLPKEIKEITKIEFELNEKFLKTGEEFQLIVKHTPSDLSSPSLIWESSSPEVATVSGGMVKALKPGETIIKTTISGKKITAEIKVKVSNIVTEKLEITPSNKSIIVGEEVTLSAKILPENATVKDLIWESADVNIATVTQEGKVTATGPGETIIKATAKDGGASSEATIRVTNVEVEGISLNVSHKELEVGTSFKLSAVVNPSNATIKDIEWSSTNLSVATVDPSGLVTAKSKGSTTLVVTAKNGIKASAEINVVGKKVQRISISPSSLDILEGDLQQMTVTFTPADAENLHATMYAGDPSIIEVQNGGIIKAVGTQNQRTEIYVHSKDNPNLMATSLVTVRSIEHFIQQRVVFDVGPAVWGETGFTGSASFVIDNESSKSVHIYFFIIEDGNGNTIIGQSLRSTLSPNGTFRYSFNLVNTFKPQLHILYRFNGTDHVVSQNL